MISSTIPFEAYQEIINKKAQYGRYVDTKKWDDFEKLFVKDTSFKFVNPDGSIVTWDQDKLDFKSTASCIEFFKRWFKNAETLHMFGPPQMVAQSDDEITATWGMEDQLNFKEGEVEEIRGGGYYHEKWVCKEGSWLMADLVLARTYVKVSL